MASSRSLKRVGLTRFVSLALLLMCTAPITRATEAFLAPDVVNARFYAVAHDAVGYWAVGERGHVVASADASQWQQQTVPLQLSLLNAVNTPLGRFAVGHEASILAFTEQGWQLRHQWPGADQPLFDLAENGQGQTIAVGAYGLYLSSNDSGQTWVQRVIPAFLLAEDRAYLSELEFNSADEYEAEVAAISPHLNALAITQQQALIAGEGGLVALSNDGGQQWQRVDIGYHGSLFAAAIVDHQTLVVGGLRGHAFISTDGGRSWSTLPIPRPVHINKILYHQDQLWLLCNAGYLYQLTPGAEEATEHRIASGADIVSGEASDSALILATTAGLTQFTF